jgi:hypothetical protein
LFLLLILVGDWVGDPCGMANGKGGLAGKGSIFPPIAKCAMDGAPDRLGWVEKGQATARAGGERV